MKTSTIIPRLTLAALLVFSSCEAFAGKSKPFIRINDVSMNAYVSGNGLGTKYNPSLGIRFGRRFVVAGGPQFCPVSWKNCGYQVGARYFLLRESESYNGHFRLTATVNATHIEKQGLGQSAIAVEKMNATGMRNDEGADFAGLRYSGWEYSAGFGFTYRFDFGLLIRSEAGIAYYDTKQVACHPITTFREDDGLGLRLGAGIGWAFAK